MERRALYHTLRVNWQLDPMLKVKAWQVKDYRNISLANLFLRLSQLGIEIDQPHFIALADSEESPEDFSETLLPDELDDPEAVDEIYLIVFELWRRLLSEKQTLSLFCDEWDYQIDLYESGNLESIEGIVDVIERFITLCQEAKEQDEDPQELYDSIVQFTAHDIETFIYDFVYAQIEEQNFPYAEEIIEAFLPFVKEKHWLLLLLAEILMYKKLSEAFSLMKQLIASCVSLNQLEFNLEFLSFLAKQAHADLFLQLIKLTLPMLETEEDFWDILTSCENYFHFNDFEQNETLTIAMRDRRFKKDPNASLNPKDQDFTNLQKMLFK